MLSFVHKITGLAFDLLSRGSLDLLIDRRGNLRMFDSLFLGPIELGENSAGEACIPQTVLFPDHTRPCVCYGFRAMIQELTQAQFEAWIEEVVSLCDE